MSLAACLLAAGPTGCTQFLGDTCLPTGCLANISIACHNTVDLGAAPAGSGLSSDQCHTAHPQASILTCTAEEVACQAHTQLSKLSSMGTCLFACGQSCRESRSLSLGVFNWAWLACCQKLAARCMHGVLVQSLMRDAFFPSGQLMEWWAPVASLALIRLGPRIREQRQ